MGNLWSRQQSDNNPPSQAQGQVSDSAKVSLSLKSLEDYNEYSKRLSLFRLYTAKFTFSHHDAYGLNKEEFHELMDLYHVEPAKRKGSEAKTVIVMYEEKGRVKKSILIFVKSKEGFYDVLVADATMESGLDKVRFGVAAVGSFLVTGALYLLNPVAGMVTGVVCTAITGSKVVYEHKHHDFQDVTIGYMIKQLIDANNLCLIRGKLAFRHNGETTLIEKESTHANDNTGTDNSGAMVPI